MSSQQPIEVKLAPGLLTALRGPKLWASLLSGEVVSFNSTVTLVPTFNGVAVGGNGQPEAYLINDVDSASIDFNLLFDGTTGKYLFPLACPNVAVTNNGGFIELTNWWTTKFPSAAPEDLLTAIFTLIVKNGAEQAYSSVTVHRLPTTVVVNSVTQSQATLTVSPSSVNRNGQFTVTIVVPTTSNPNFNTLTLTSSLGLVLNLTNDLEIVSANTSAPTNGNVTRTVLYQLRAMTLSAFVARYGSETLNVTISFQATGVNVSAPLVVQGD